MPKGLTNSKIIILLCLFEIFCLNQLFSQVLNAELLNMHSDIVVKNNRLYKTHSCDILINNRQGEKYAEVSIPFSKMQKVSKIEACIKTKDGNVIRKLKQGEIKERSEFPDYSFYEDCYVKEFSLYHNEYPYIISYSYQQQEDEFLWIDNWSPTIDTDLPCSNAALTIEIPLSYRIAFKSHLIDSFRVDTTKTSIIYKWKCAYIKTLSHEIFSPYLFESIPYVKIIPLDFKYETEGSFKDWSTYGNWEYRLMSSLSELSGNEKVKINTLLQNVNSDKEKIKVLYHYLQDVTRYINISIERGGMKPYPASYVCTNKYGDCKALTNYFKAILDYVGIPAFVADVYAGTDIKIIDAGFPSQQFNHVILCVPQLKDTLWFDCTSKGPYNYLGSFTQNRYAFVIDQHNSRLVRTPLMQINDVLEARNIKVNSIIANNLTVSFHNTYKGRKFESLSSLSESTNVDTRADIIRNYYVDEGFELIDYTLIHSHRDSVFIELNYRARNDKLIMNYGNEELLKIIPFSLPAFKDIKTRLNDVEINMPVYYSDTIEYQIPAGFIFVETLKPVKVETVYGKYSVFCKTSNNSVFVYKKFILNSGYYSLKQYPDFYTFIKTVKALDSNSHLVFKKNE